MSVQMQLYRDQVWIHVADFPHVTPHLESFVREAKGALRLVDRGTEQILVRSLKARGVPWPKAGNPMIRHYRLGLAKPEELDQSDREDPKPRKIVKSTIPRFSRWSDT